jgi:hypothetical protein
MLAVLGINALGIILNLLKLIHAYNALLKGKRIKTTNLKNMIISLETTKLKETLS